VATVCGDARADITWSELARSEASVYPTVTPANDEDEDGFFSHDIFKVFAAEKKKHGDKASKAPELSAPALSTPAPTTAAADNSRPDAQY